MGKQIRITAPTAEGAILRLLDVCNAADIATAVDMFIERLDKLDGDPDLEPKGDEVDGVFAEDDFCTHNLVYPGAGCPVADGNCATGAGAGDPSWPEWQTRGRHKVTGRGAEAETHNIDGWQHDEDDEDDDPVEANGDERETGNAEDEGLAGSALQWRDRGSGCPIADPADRDDADGGHCLTFGIDQTHDVSEAEAFHDLNGIKLIRVPLPANDTVSA